MTDRRAPARTRAFALPVFVGLILVPGFGRAQEPPDTVTVVADTTQVPPDSLVATVDTFPLFPAPRAAGYGFGVWEWDRAALSANRALTLTELLSQIPGVLGLRSGDYGTPATVVAFGGTEGRVRVLWDGFEMVPLDGSVADLSRIGLGALERVRVERDGGELRVDLTTLQPLEPDPVTDVHVGTGDLGTNILRADFAHPNTLGGALTFSLDRLETRGPALDDGGSTSGVSLRYGLRPHPKGGVVAELRRYDAANDFAGYPESVTRNDVTVRARWKPLDGLVAEGFWGRSSLSPTEDDPVFGLVDYGRSQSGVRVGLERDRYWASASGRRYGGGSGLADRTLELQAGVEWEGLGRAEARASRSWWPDTVANRWSARLETGSYRGFSAFGSADDGRRAIPDVRGWEARAQALAARDSAMMVDTPTQDTIPVPDAPTLRVTDRRSYRVGGTFEWREIRLSGAWLAVEADSLHPTGLVYDRTGLVVGGGERTGFEVAATLPLGSGFRFDAAYQQWDEEWPYMPKATWDGTLAYHGIFKETGNLEVWGELGVAGRDPMLLPLSDPDPETVPEDGSPALTRVPFQQEWFGFIQIRIVSVSIFVRWENLTGKRDNQDFPERVQPRFRTLYGVRWMLRN